MCSCPSTPLLKQDVKGRVKNSVHVILTGCHLFITILRAETEVRLSFLAMVMQGDQETKPLIWDKIFRQYKKEKKGHKSN